MTKDWTFSRRIVAGFSAMVVLIIAVGLISVVALNSVVSSKDRVINVNYRLLLDARSLSTASSQADAANRGFLLTGENTYLTELKTARQAFQTNLADLQASDSTATERRLADAIQQSEKAHVKRSMPSSRCERQVFLWRRSTRFFLLRPTKRPVTSSIRRSPHLSRMRRNCSRVPNRRRLMMRRRRSPWFLLSQLQPSYWRRYSRSSSPDRFDAESPPRSAK